MYKNFPPGIVSVELAIACAALPCRAGATWWAVPAMSGVQRLPDAIPADGKEGGTVRIVAARGEYEPGSFVVRADEDLGKVEGMPSLEGKKMFLYLAPRKAGEKKKSQQARDREAAVEAEKKGERKEVEERNAPISEIDAETPANGSLFANAKISADALKKLTNTEEE